MKILVTGAGGQLGSEFVRRLAGAHELTGLDRRALDIGDEPAVQAAVTGLKPGLIINCAADNRVDRAEADPDAARRTNTLGVRCLARAAVGAGALLVHYGTDYVFDGEKRDFYREADAVGPLNRYGESKLAGERTLAESGARFLLFRVSWVYGGRNESDFLWKMARLAAAGTPLRVTCDQVSSPTRTEVIVDFTMRAVARGLEGLYHLAGAGYASRYEFARAFFRIRRPGQLVLPVCGSCFPAPARRPYFSALSTQKLEQDLGSPLPAWEESLADYARRADRRQP